MPKRLTNTDKWKDPFLRALEAPYKLLYFYILDDCDHAGIWTPDFEVAAIRIGAPINEKHARENLAPRVVFLKNGRWFLPEFVSDQYGELSEKNRLHVSVLQLLKKNDTPNKPLISPLEGVKYKYKDKDKDKEINKKESEKIEIVYPFESPKFRQMWDNWVRYRKESGHPYRSDLSLQAALKKLATWPEDTAIAVMEQSIANGWQGLFDIKNQTSNGKQLTPRDQKELDRKLGIANHFAKRFGSDAPAGRN